jgi:hypothetical protein
LNKLFITIGNDKQIWIRIRIKAWIQTINLFLNNAFLNTFTVVIIDWEIR